MRSSNPDDYRNDVLAKIIFKILNPLGNHDECCIISMHAYCYECLGKRGNFYDDVANCPSWFPPLVKFRRPNHPKGLRVYTNVEFSIAIFSDMQ